MTLSLEFDFQDINMLHDDVGCKLDGAFTDVSYRYGHLRGSDHNHLRRDCVVFYYNTLVEALISYKYYIKLYPHKRACLSHVSNRWIVMTDAMILDNDGSIRYPSEDDSSEDEDEDEDEDETPEQKENT